MPILQITGIPQGHTWEGNQAFNQMATVFREHLKAAVAEIEALGLKSTDVSVQALSANYYTNNGQEIICFVKGLYAHRTRTKLVLTTLAIKVKDAMVVACQECKLNPSLIEVFVEPPIEQYFTATKHRPVKIGNQPEPVGVAD